MRVLHTLAQLRHSGAEQMLACSYRHWRDGGIEPIVAGMGDDPHPFAERLRQAGYDVHLLPPVRSVTGLAALRRTIRAVRPAIVHVHSESCYDAVSLLAATSPGVNGIVRTVHTNFRFTGQLRMRRMARAAFARRLGVVWVACSREVAETERSYFRYSSSRIVENWIDVNRLEREATPAAGAAMRRSLGIAPDKPVLALVGNCGSAKNHELVARALCTLEMPVELLHVGDRRKALGAERGAWERVPGRHRVHHLGARDDVPALLAASDLALLPSLYEGFPLVAAEAVCAGVPLLAADTVGLQWLSEMPSASLLPLECTAWAKSIGRALSGPPGRLLVKASAVKARARFRPERGVSEYRAAYAAALAAGPSLWAPGGRRRPATHAGA